MIDWRDHSAEPRANLFTKVTVSAAECSFCVCSFFVLNPEKNLDSILISPFAVQIRLPASMDIYGAASTAITQVIQVTIFIKGVIADIKSYDEDRRKIQVKLELQLTSLEFFRRRFFDEKRGLMLPGQLSDRAVNSIYDLLLNMNGVLGEYAALIARYNLWDDLELPKALGESEEAFWSEWKQRSVDRVKTKFKALKLKGYHWALFDRKKLLNVLAEYQEWTNSLRDVMQHFAQEAIYDLANRGSEPSLKGTGLEPVVKRQQMAAFAHAPEDFQELDGEVVEGTSQSNQFQLAQWVHNGETEQVVIEYHDYAHGLLQEDLEENEVLELKQPVRDLVWLLQNSAFTVRGEEPDQSNQPTIYSLQCLGYKDEVDKHRFTFFYQLPPVSSDVENKLLTLHELINQLDDKTRQPLKPSLGSRFNIAYCLALSLLNIHGSSWLHKNIWSRGILLFHKGDNGIEPFETKPTGTSKTCLGFLGDWGYARPIGGNTQMRSNFDIESNLYLHPERQGSPGREFARRHDIYALGVVLLEIGVWRTASQLFGSQIKDAQRAGKLPKSKDVYTALLGLAKMQLGKEMGERYAAAVVACLTGDLSQTSDLELSLDFRDKVVNAIALGREL
jgi:hypothetical protein